MQLSRFTDYSLRVLFYVAVNNDRLCHLAEISEYYGISTEHLRKVVHGLAKSGHLKTYRGKHGGIKLGLATDEINIGQVVEQTEGGGPLINCDQPSCLLMRHCTLKPVFFEAQQAFMNVLKGYTLADLLSDPLMKQQIISHR